VVDSSWRCTGAEELPCELVREWCFLGSGILVKQLRSQRKEMGIERERESGMGWGRLGEQGQCQELNLVQVMVPNVRKNAAHKESSGEKSHVHRAKFNGRPKLPTWQGKDGTAPSLGEQWLL
jgi:hypothetical protein